MTTELKEEKQGKQEKEKILERKINQNTETKYFGKKINQNTTKIQREDQRGILLIKFKEKTNIYRQEAKY